MVLSNVVNKITDFMWWVLIVFIAYVSMSCKSHVNFDDIQRINNLFYYQGKPYSGELINLFENSNTIAYKAVINKGIPNGKSVSYGYDGEVVSEGKFILLGTDGGNDYSRITLERVREMDVEINTLFVISSILKTTNEKTRILKIVDSVLTQHNLPDDTKIEFVQYEF